MKKNNKGNGMLFSKELKETIKRIKHVEPEIKDVIKRDTGKSKKTIIIK